jgi:hypothetical protein
MCEGSIRRRAEVEALAIDGSSFQTTHDVDESHRGQTPDLLTLIQDQRVKRLTETLGKGPKRSDDTTARKRKPALALRVADIVGVKDGQDRDVTLPKPMVDVPLAAPPACEKYSNSGGNLASAQLSAVRGIGMAEGAARKENGTNGNTAPFLDSRPHPAAPTTSSMPALQPRRRPKRIIDLGPEPDYDALK